ncbi:MAG: hypothetical protein K8T89_05290 [Planctomycetes bacterium]|nr:hypothetical protein [Planctomycetota bacterium]
MSTDSSGDSTVNRRWERFCVFEFCFLIVSCFFCLWIFSLPQSQWGVVVLSGLFGWHLFAITLCIFYLAGSPIVMTLSLLSPEGRALRRKLRDRSAMDDLEFWNRYYRYSATSTEIPCRLRHLLRRDIDPLIDRAIPSDPIHLLLEELDFADVIKLIESNQKSAIMSEETTTQCGG